MEFHFTNKLEDYYQKFVELQEKLRKSEEQRFQLEMKFNEMVQIGRLEQQEHYRKLKAQYKRFLEEDSKRQERNERILRNLERVETRISMLSAKTERIDLLRRQYRNYLIRTTTETSKLKPIIKEECKTPFSSSTQTQTNQKMEFLDRYLDRKSSNYNSNKASEIAEDIMNSIYSRHYNKPKESGDATKDISFRKPQEIDDNLKVESVYSLANNEIELPSRDEAFVSALDVAVQQLSENKARQVENKPNNQKEVSTIYYNQEYQDSESREEEGKLEVVEKPGNSEKVVQFSNDSEIEKLQVDNFEKSVQDEPILPVESTVVQLNETEVEQLNLQELDTSILPVESTNHSEVVEVSNEGKMAKEEELNVQVENSEPVEITENCEVSNEGEIGKGEKLNFQVENLENTEQIVEQDTSILPVESPEKSEVSNEGKIGKELNLNLENTEQIVEQDNPNLPVENTDDKVENSQADNFEISEPVQQVTPILPLDHSDVIQPTDQNILLEASITNSQPGLVENPPEPNNQPYYPEQYDQYVYNQQGEVVEPQFDENGQMLPQYDENGQLIMLYDHEGRAYFEETQPAYEDYGYEQDQSYPQTYEPNQEEKLGNVMDILDTDTEASSKHNASKLSNDTDFDFS